MGRRSLIVTAIATAVVIAAVLVTTERPVATQSSTASYTAVDLGTLGGASSVARGVGDLVFAIAGSSTTPSGATHAFRYRFFDGFKDLGTLGGSNSEALAVSWDSSHVAGRAKLATTKYHAFLWTDGYPNAGPMIDLGTLGGSESGAYGVNSWGTVVGWSHTAGDTATRAFVYRDGTMSPVAVSFGGSNSTALAVNEYDHIVGQASLAGNAVSHAFLYIDGVARDLGSPAGTSVATAINDYDQVAGYWLATNNTSSRAFIYTGGAMQTLPGLGGSFAYARAVDSAGVVVGEADTSGGVRHAVRWRNGAIEDLNTLLAAGSGWVLQAATGSDGRGNIVGYGLHNGQTRAFLLSPPVDLFLSVATHSNQLDTNIPNPQEAGRSLDLGATIAHDSPYWVTGIVITDTLTGPVQYTSWNTSVADCTQAGQTLTCRLKDALGPGAMPRDLMLRVRTTGPGTITHTATVRADQADPDVANNTQTESNRILSLASFTLNTPVVGGSPALGRTTLTSPTGSGGSTVKLASSNPAVATVPSQFDVLPWDNDGLWREFYVTTQPVTEQTTVQISATFGLETITNTLTILPSTPSSPYGGSARAVPGTIQAEDFDDGGEGVAYHDSNTANNGGYYRSTGVDIETTSDSGGGFDVGWIRVGEWLKFTVNVAAAGTYNLEARVASAGAGGTFHLEANGSDRSGAIAVPDTGGWQSWRTVSRPVTLGAGVQVLRLAFDATGPNGAIGNLNWIRLTSTGGGSAPFGGVLRALPGTVQAEDFDDGGEGVAYHDTTSGNAGGAYRSKHVDIEVTADAGSGYNVGWMTAGEWLKYTVTVSAAGTYTLSARVAAKGEGGTYHVEVDGLDKTGPITIPNTGGWQTWTTVTRRVTLPAGTQVLRVVLDANGPTGVFGNLNYLTLAP